MTRYPLIAKKTNDRGTVKLYSGKKISICRTKWMERPLINDKNGNKERGLRRKRIFISRTIMLIQDARGLAIRRNL